MLLWLYAGSPTPSGNVVMHIAFSTYHVISEYQVINSFMTEAIII